MPEIVNQAEAVFGSISKLIIRVNNVMSILSRPISWLGGFGDHAV